jgi:hypothetical protein
MHTVYEERGLDARKISGQFRPGTDKIVRRLFGPIAKVVWPHNTEAYVATVAKCDVRSARRWISGEINAPAKVWAAIFTEATQDD